MPKEVLQPIPAPEAAPAAAPNETAGLDMTRPSEEMRRGILGEVGKLKNLEGAFNAKQFVSNNKLNESRKDSTNSFFQLLSDMGVDPNNLSSINEFLQKLEASDPDLFVIFERAFSELMGEASGGGPQQPVVPEEEGAGLENKLTDLQQSVQRQQ